MERKISEMDDFRPSLVMIIVLSLVWLFFKLTGGVVLDPETGEKKG